MKLKDLLKLIQTYDKIKIAPGNGEDFYIAYANISDYENYTVISISATDKHELLIEIALA